MRAHTRHFALVTIREAAQGDQMEHAYQVRIPDPEARGRLVQALDRVPGVHDISLHLQDPTLEV